MTAWVIELQNIILQSTLYSKDDNTYRMISRNGSTNVVILILTNDKEITAKTDSVDHARKATEKKIRGEAAKEGPLSCEKTPFASKESRISS